MNQFARYLLNKQLKKLGINLSTQALMPSYAQILAKSHQWTSTSRVVKSKKITSSKSKKKITRSSFI
jgi:hypothetical protein